MRFDIYGRFQVDVIREGERWIVYRLDFGKRRMMSDFVIPSEMRPNEVKSYLDDMLHEWARPGQTIRQID